MHNKLIACCVLILALGASRIRLYAAESEAERILRLYDKDHDGKLSLSELTEYILKEKSPYKALKPDAEGKVNYEDVRKQAAVDAKKVTDKFGGVERSLDAKDVKVALVPSQDEKDLFDELGSVIRFKKSFLSAASEALPANFSWTKGTSSSAYSVDAALGLRQLHLWDADLPSHELILETAPSIEGHVSSDPKASQNSISARLPLDFRYGVTADSVTNALVPSHYFTLAPVYETDKDWKVRTISVQPLYTLNVPKLGIGSISPLAGGRSDPIVFFRWRPYVGFDLGHVLATGGNPVLKKNGDFERFYSQLHGELWFTKQFLIAGDIYDHLELNEDQRNFVYGEVSPTFYIDAKQRFSVGLTFKEGKTTPAFQEVRSINLWAGFKF